MIMLAPDWIRNLVEVNLYGFRKVGDTKHPINPNLGPLSKGAVLWRGTNADGVVVRRALYGHFTDG